MISTAGERDSSRTVVACENVVCEKKRHHVHVHQMFQLQLVSEARDLKIQILPPLQDLTSTTLLLAFKRDASVADHPLCFSG